MRITSNLPRTLESFPAPAAEIIETVTTQFGKLDSTQIQSLMAMLDCSLEELMLALLPVAASMSVADISEFHVGAVAQGLSGALYLGTNLEFSGLPLKSTVHAEQFAVVNAWHRGEQGLKKLAVNEAPCGHCRQFLNELHLRDRLQIIIQRQSQQPVRLDIETLLPENFGPEDLGMDGALMQDLNYPLELPAEFEGDELVETALFAASKSYAPICQSRAGIALRLVSGQVVTGRYGANCAFNPGITAIESAAVNWRLALLADPNDRIEEAVMVEQPSKSSQRILADAFFQQYNIRCRYIEI